MKKDYFLWSTVFLLPALLRKDKGINRKKNVFFGLPKKEKKIKIFFHLNYEEAMNLLNNSSCNGTEVKKKGVKGKNGFIYFSLPYSFFLVIANPITTIHPF